MRQCLHFLRAFCGRLIAAAAALVLLSPAAGARAAVHLNEEKPGGWEQRNLLRITVMNFYQNDAFVLECGGKVMLLDGGTQRHWHKFSRYLEERGMSHVDMIFNSHPHDDHLNAVTTMLRMNVLTADLFVSPFEREVHARAKDNPQPALVSQLDRLGIPYWHMLPEQTLTLGGASMKLYRWGDGKDDNAKSGMLWLHYGSATMLFTADAEGDTLQWITEHYTPDQLKSDILKAPHHGIAWIMPEFLEAVDPELTVVTGKPDAKVFDQMEQQGIPALCNYDGYIVLETDGTDWYVTQERVRP